MFNFFVGWFDKVTGRARRREDVEKLKQEILDIAAEGYLLPMGFLSDPDNTLLHEAARQLWSERKIEIKDHTSMSGVVFDVWGRA